MNKEVLQLALDALVHESWCSERLKNTPLIIEALRAELDKPEPEPVAWRRIDRHGVLWLYSPNEDHHEEAEPLYRKEDV